MPLFGPPNIAQLEAKRDTQGLIKALGFKDAAIRMAAADALAPLKDPMAVEPLVGLLGDEHPGVRRAAVAALSARGGFRVVEPLVSALEDRDPEVRATARTAVYRRLMTDPDQDARRAATAALGRIRAGDAVETLIKATIDADEGVRVAAIRRARRRPRVTAHMAERCRFRARTIRVALHVLDPAESRGRGLYALPADHPARRREDEELPAVPASRRQGAQL